MKKVCIILWVVICIVFLLGLLSLFTGSLEMFPTPEQQGKVHIISIIMMVASAFSGVVLFLTKKR